VLGFSLKPSSKYFTFKTF